MGLVRRRMSAVTHQPADEATATAWAALGGAPELAARVAYLGPAGGLPSGLPVRELARACVGVCSLAAAELLAGRNGGPVSAVTIDEGAVAAAFVSEGHLLVDGHAEPGFAPLSGFWRTADGWVRTHANYPHHRTRLLAALGLPESAGKTELAAELRRHRAEWVQETAYAAGALAVAVAPPQPASRAQLVETVRATRHAPRTLPPDGLPAAGIRVLDLTRVIAGPVATRTLALLGADVLRIDSPLLPESHIAHSDTGFGKRSACLDLADEKDSAVFEELLATADVVVSGYRPGALDRYGLTPDGLFARRPGLVVAELSAWGWSGPWSGRRGFDSLVQAARGISVVEAGPDGQPGVLPAQALDHGTGYLLAAAVLRALTEQLTEGAGRHSRLSLSATADWLLHGLNTTLAPVDASPYDAAPYLTETPSAYGLLRHARTPVSYQGSPDDWAHPPTCWGTDAPAWA